MKHTLRLSGLLLVIAGCHRVPAATAALKSGVHLRADSGQYSVRTDGASYLVTIGYRLENTTGSTISDNYCHVPSPKGLEKQGANGDWEFAYSGVTLMCRSSPPFRVADGGTYRGTFLFSVVRPRTNVAVSLGPDSAPGVYRLRWDLRAGADPDDKGRPLIAAVSPPFTVVMP